MDLIAACLIFHQPLIRLVWQKIFRKAKPACNTYDHPPTNGGIGRKNKSAYANNWGDNARLFFRTTNEQEEEKRWHWTYYDGTACPQSRELAVSMLLFESSSCGQVETTVAWMAMHSQRHKSWDAAITCDLVQVRPWNEISKYYSDCQDSFPQPAFLVKLGKASDSNFQGKWETNWRFIYVPQSVD